MRLNVDLDQLLSLNQSDPNQTAKQLDLMRQEGVSLNLKVRRPATTEVFKHLPGSQTPMRFLLRWFMNPKGIFAAIGIVTYGAMAFVLF